MLIAFYSTLIIFLILFIVTIIYLVSLIKRKRATGGNVIALFFLLLLTGFVSGIYGFDFIKLQAGEVEKTEGNCFIEFNDNGKSIATTTVEIDENVYQIKGDTYNHLRDGTYECTVHYLPVTKIIESLHVEK
ncbi:cobalamin biosynthesis protein CobN [Lysinibacillus sp. 54212]|uniref:cobalamin biosynthesis protein CobN n=1 Tax=Lysinibacillus sp. 54212 TaxID=3119829 RepID=UPI002FCAD78B